MKYSHGRLEHYDLWNYSNNNVVDINIEVFYKETSYEEVRQVHGKDTQQNRPCTNYFINHTYDSIIFPIQFETTIHIYFWG